MTKSDMTFILKEYGLDRLYDEICNELRLNSSSEYDRGYRVGYNDGLNHSYCRYIKEQ